MSNACVYGSKTSRW